MVEPIYLWDNGYKVLCINTDDAFKVDKES